MAWGWSYTDEGILGIRENVFALPVDDLRVIWAEWQVYDFANGDSDDWCEETYEQALSLAATLASDTLAEYIFERAAGNATCDNGAWQAWTCPYGCGCHTVSPGR